MAETQRTYTQADREEGYQTWRKLGSLRRTAAALGISEHAVISWSRAEGWSQRRQRDDDRDRSIVLAQARIRLTGEVDRLIDRLLDLSTYGTNQDGVRLRATLSALALAGLSERQPHADTPTTVISPAMVTDSPSLSRLAGILSALPIPPSPSLFATAQQEISEGEGEQRKEGVKDTAVHPGGVDITHDES